jgi:PIN domain nuclease of toxin-antitoxin system
MNLLIDTHTLIWFIEDAPEMSEKARNLITDIDNPCFVSIASIWEIAIKLSIGKLKMKYPFDKLSTLLWENSIELLPIRIEHTKELISMPFHHKDPFDRLIISQARIEHLTIISKDDNFRSYDINQIW